jgi:hypothetical protein
LTAPHAYARVLVSSNNTRSGMLADGLYPSYFVIVTRA